MNSRLTPPPFDSLLVLSFGGPEGREDVLPFLENVLRGKNVPRTRMLEVAEHYYQFDGVSPINDQNRALIQALEREFANRGIDLPIYWANRNWHPLLPATLGRMANAGKQRALAFFTSLFSSYSGCRQYRENVAAAQTELGDAAPRVEKLRMGFNHPKFIQAQSDQVVAALKPIDSLSQTKVLFTAHSIPHSMAEHCSYVAQLNEAARLVAESVGVERWELVFQSRSGPPHQPWLEPDVCERIEQLAEAGEKGVVLVPIGFVSDHMEVVFDLDTEAAEKCLSLGIQFSRAATVGTHPAFVSMIADLIEERISGTAERACLGDMGPSHDVCPTACCLYPRGS